VLFGVVPDGPAVGYGYVETAKGADGDGSVLSFHEKPDRETAQSYVDRGTFFWNTGMFLFSPPCMINEAERWQPEMLAACRESLEGARADLGFLRLEPTAYERIEPISLDRAIMEHSDRLRLVCANFTWSDVGAWGSLWGLGTGDDDGNVVARGEAILEDAQGCLVYSDGPKVALVGVEDLAVVATKDAVLVVRRDRTDDVGRIATRLLAQRDPTATQPTRVFRPWGFYEGLIAGERFQVKQISVDPGSSLSLQYHLHRAEHWVVVEGTARVIIEGKEHLVSENESIFVPLGARHRLENPGKVPLRLIEVQSGAYLGEDDIFRIDDEYRRG
jgi:mannose-1-phosphate guanylyltransferase/mannose-6-phosphate isomerase